MIINIRENNIGIVVRGNFQELKPTPKLLLNKGVITQEEFDGQDEDCIIAPSEMKYTLGSLSFVGDPTRIQVTSNDISLSGRISRLVSDILMLAGEKPLELKSVGINAGVLFTFNNLDDALMFGKHYGMLDSASPFMSEPRLRSVTYEDNVKANATEQKVIIKLSALEVVKVNVREGVETKDAPDDVPLCTLDINNHFPVTNREEAIGVIQKAEALHVEFREKYDKNFKSL